MGLQDDTTELAELLARALLEQKSADEPELALGSERDDDEDEGLSAAELAERVAALEDTIFALTHSTEPGVDPAADLEAGFAEDEVADDSWDDDEWADTPSADAVLAEAKAAWSACPDCGSTNVDEYADGTARCEDCGTPLIEAKGFDFDELGDDPDLDDLEDDLDDDLEAKGWEGDGDELPEDPDDEDEIDAVALSEMELLMARRAAL